MLGRNHAEYLKGTTEKQRIYDFYWFLWHNQKKKYFSTSEKDRAGFFSSHGKTDDMLRTDLDKMIEESKELARAKKAAEQNGAQPVG